MVKDLKIYAPHEIISHLHNEVRYTLQQAQSESMKDGLDMSLVLIDRDNQALHFSGSMQKVMYFSALDSEPQARILLGHKYSIGGTREHLKPETELINYKQGDVLYLLSDGLVDQPVQQDDALKRMLFDEWVKLFANMVSKGLPTQETQLNAYIESQLRLYEQRDDIKVMGVRL